MSLKLIGGILRYIAIPAGSCICENRSYPRLIELDKRCSADPMTLESEKPMHGRPGFVDYRFGVRGDVGQLSHPVV